ncbi:MAG TPA: hypothetical protein VFS21_04875 [Roseiflexaceae bacterium]|nr:hypothetical protein [Roseiflexaceae bacterium]
MLALSAALILIPLLYLPGFLLAAALLDAPPADPLERHFERTVVGALLNGWLALTLAELGVFSAALHIALLAALCLPAGLVAWRRGALLRPGPLGIVAQQRLAAPGLLARAVARWDVLAFAAVGLLFAALVGRPFEVVFGVRDAGVYANTGMAIARTGGIVQYDAVVAGIGRDQASEDQELRGAAEQAETNFLGAQNPNRFVATRLRAAGFLINQGDLARGQIVPQHFHMFSAWIGLLAGLLGPLGGLLAPGLLGLLGVWSVGMLGRRLAGPWVGLLAMLLLSLSGPQVWFSRYSTAEAATQFQTFAGLYAFAVMAGTQRAAGATRRALPLDRASFAALLAGLAFGQWALTRIDFLLVVPLLAAYLLWAWLTRRWGRPQTLLALGYAAMLLHALLHILFIARAYFLDTLYARLQDQSALVAATVLPFLTERLRVVYVETPRSVLKDPFRLPLELVLLAGGIALCLWLRRDGRLLAWGERQAARWGGRLLAASALAILLAGAYGYFIRPQILSPGVLAALPGCLAPEQLRAPQGACLTLQGYIGAPIALPPGREVYTIPLGSMVRVGWYLSPLGMALAALGFALWWRRGMGRDSWLFLGLGLLCSVVFFRQTYGAGDQTYIYILRRFVPQVYPTLCLGIAFALAALAGKISSTRAPNDTTIPEADNSKLKTQSSKLKTPRFLAATFLSLGLVAFLALTGRTIYRHVEYGGALAQLEAAAARFGPEDVLLFRGGAPVYASARDIPDLLTTPLTYAFGRNALTVKSEEPGNYAEPLARYVRRWQEEGRTVYLALGASGGLGLPGFRLEPAGAIALDDLREFEQLTSQKPTNVRSFGVSFTVYRVLPGAPAPTTALAPGDFASQLRGFYNPERLGGETVAWTDGEALLRLQLGPDGPPEAVSLRLAGGKRPAAIGPARVCLDYRAEPSLWVENPAASFTSAPQCATLTEGLADYRFTIDRATLPATPTGTLLLRLKSESAWVPAAVDPALLDGRSLGVQFGGLEVTRNP